MEKKVDFRKLNVEVKIDEWREQDVAKPLANAMYGQVATLDEDELVRRIYHSEGALELSDTEVRLLDALMERSGIVYAVRKAVGASQES